VGAEGPEKRERKREQLRRWRAANRERVAAWNRAYADANREKINGRQRVYDAAPARVAWQAARHRRRVAAAAAAHAGGAATGSVLATAAPGHWRGVLAALTAGAPRCADRDEVVAEAALLCVQGLDVAAALAQARRTVARGDPALRTALPVAGIAWL
jgi:hypothetical protein